MKSHTADLRGAGWAGLGPILTIFALGLLALSLWRAVTAGLVHDEAASYTIVASEASMFANTLNNHMLNTACMRVSGFLFGMSELSLRLHTVLAHGLYLVCSILVLRHVDTRAARVAGFALLNLNLFMLDFMFLARGYGLAMGFQLLSILLLLNASAGKSLAAVLRPLVLALLAAGISVLANFSFINFFVPACLVALVIAMRWRKTVHWNRGAVAGISVVLAGVGAFGAVMLYRVFETWSQGKLSWGKPGSVVEPVLRSMVRTWLYWTDLPSGTLLASMWIVVALMVLAVGCSLWRVWRARSLGPLEWVVMIGLVSIGLTMAQHFVLGIAPPVERHGLFLLAPWMLAIALALGTLQARTRPRWLSVAALAACMALTSAMALRFATGLSMGQTYTWRYDSNSKDALLRIEADRRVRYPLQAISVGNHWAFEPAMNYYRERLGYSWMAPLAYFRTAEAPIGETGHQYVYVFGWQRGGLPEPQYSIMKLYEDSDTALLRVETDAQGP